MKLASPDDLQAGDLLRLRFSEENLLAFVLVGSVSVSPKSSPESTPDLYRLRSSTVFFFRHVESPLPAGDGSAIIFTHAGERKVFARTVQPAETESPPSSPLQTLRARPESAALDLAAPLAEAPEPGTFLRVDLEAGQLWLIVEQIGTGEEIGSPSARALRVSGESWWVVHAPNVLPSLPLAERVNLELRSGAGMNSPHRLTISGSPKRIRVFGTPCLPTRSCMASRTSPGRSGAPKRMRTKRSGALRRPRASS